jgi:hypothetical protein
MVNRRNEKKLEEIVNDFERKENLCRCEVGLKNIVRYTWRNIRL